MASLLISGPAGGGKSQRARDLLLASQVPTVVVDFQSLYAAILQLSREENGRYPPRSEEHVHALAVAEYGRRSLITGAIQDGVEVIATNSDGSQERRQQLLALLGANAVEEIIDPGISVVTERLSVDGVLSEQCSQAIGRWYQMRQALVVETRQEANDLVATLVQESLPPTDGRQEVFVNGSIEWQGGIDIKLVHLGASESRVVPERQPDGRITIKAPLTPAMRQAYEVENKRHMSVEFFPIEEQVNSGIRTFKRALLIGAAMVVKPSYGNAKAELREETPKRKLVLLP